MNNHAGLPYVGVQTCVSTSTPLGVVFALDCSWADKCVLGAVSAHFCARGLTLHRQGLTCGPPCSHAASLGTAGDWCDSCCLALVRLWWPGHLWVGSMTVGPRSGSTQLDGRPAAPARMPAQTGLWHGLEAPGASLPALAIRAVGAQTRRTHECPGTWSHIPSPSRRAGSPRQSPAPTLALCQGVNQGPAREGSGLSTHQLPVLNLLPMRESAQCWAEAPSVWPAVPPSQQPFLVWGWDGTQNRPSPTETLPPHPGQKRQQQR